MNSTVRLHLNPSQRQAVCHTGSALLVLAGAGSGKTRVITEKIAWLIRSEKVSPSRIAAVTFTNKAAREMKSRVTAMFKPVNDTALSTKGLWISTFHSLGIRILRSNPQLAGLRPGFSIVDPADALIMLNDLLADRGGRDAETASRVLGMISRWKNEGLGTDQARPDASNPISRMAHEIYTLYNRYLRACNTADLDDLIFLPVQLLRNDPELCSLWQEKIRYLLVDEYQDTNGAQYELVKMLSGSGSRLTLVGDDDQSIYSWRGARPENLTRLDADFPNLTLVKLEQNYRSAGRILKAANHLIEHNPRPFAKNLWSELGYGDAISIRRARNEEVEAEKTVSAILSRQFRSNAEHRDFAILYRSNRQARILETKLREMRIPYRISGGPSFFDRSEIRDIMAYLRLLTNSADDTAFLRIINTPRRGIGSSALEKITRLASEAGQSLLETITDIDLAGQVSARQLKTLRHFSDWILETRDRALGDDPAAAIQTMLEQMDYRRWLTDSGDESAAESRWANVQNLVDWIESLSQNQQDSADDEPGLPDILSQVVLSDILDRQKDDANGNEVSLMTLHASKGLEFRHVFIVGVEEEILPHRVSVQEDAIDEERRLFYVGITRAMQTLTISCCQVRRRYGELVSCDPSRFLEELPSAELEWEDRMETDEEEQQQTGRSHLARIRAGLSSQGQP